MTATFRVTLFILLFSKFSRISGGMALVSKDVHAFRPT